MDTSQLSKKIKYGIKWQAIISVVSQVLYFINGVILARILGPKEFGIYGMAQIVSSFVWMFWQLGLNAAIVQRKEIDRAHLDTAFTISMVMGVCCAILTWFSAPFIAKFFNEPKVVSLTRVIAFTFVIYAFDRVPSALLGRELRFKEAAIPNLLNAIVYPMVAIPMALLGFGAMSFVWGVVAGAVGMVCVRYYWLFKYFDWRPRIYFEKKAAKDLLGFGVFLTLKSLLDFVMINLQKIIIGRSIGAIDLGYYNRAANLSWLPLAKIQSVVNAALLPTFSRIQDNVEKTRDWYRKFLFLTYVLVAPFLIFFIFFGKLFILVVFGEKWLFSYKLLVWTSLSTLVLLPNMYWENMINARGLSHVLFRLKLSQLVVFVCFLCVGVKFGVVGIVIAVFCYRSIFVCPQMLFYLHKIASISFKDHFIVILEPMMYFLLWASMVLIMCMGVHVSSFVKFIIVSFCYLIGSMFYYVYRIKIKTWSSILQCDIRDLLRFF